jgi:hypothetical protein
MQNKLQTGSKEHGKYDAELAKKMQQMKQK